MAILLSSLKTFAAETAGKDVSDAAADREIAYWINSAIQRVWSATNWNWAIAEGRIVYDVVETGSGLTVTAGSRDFVLVAEAFDQKYLDEKWHLHVDGEDTMTFELEEISSATTARMLPGHNWTQDSDTGVEYTWSRHKYPLPDAFSKVISVRSMQTRQPLAYVEADRFDRARQVAPTQRGSDPIFYTVRKHALEIWPGPASTYRTLLVTYRRGPTTYDVDASGDTEIDWPDSWDDLLLKAITLEASITQGKNAPVPYQLALHDYESRLAVYMAEDSGAQELSGPMTLNMGWERPDDTWAVSPRTSTIPEV